MRSTLVMKFGGTSLMTVERIKNAAKIVVAAAKDNRVLVVVSAMGHATDELIQLADETTALPDKRELDALMATGEQVSATLMAMAIQALGCNARSFSGAQAGILTDGRFGDARVTSMNSKLFGALLSEGTIPVVTGFQGTTAGADLTTLGRGGSDTTAIALAAAVRAKYCDIYTDVDGLYSADPRIVRTATKLKTVAVSEMLELAKSGAQVLNSRSVEVARDKHVAVRVRSTFNPSDEGTLVTASSKGCKFTGAAHNSNVNCIDIHLQKLELGLDRRLSTFRFRRSQSKRNLLQFLSDAGIDAEIVDPVKLNPFRILVLVKKAETITALEALRRSDLSIRSMSVKTDISAVSIVATSLRASHYAAANSAMLSKGIEITAHAWHRQRITLVIPQSMVNEAVNLLHSQFADINVTANKQEERYG